MGIRSKTELIVVHCSATRASQRVGAKEIDKMHRERGFDGIGYHAVIRRSGEIEWGRQFNEVGAHVKGYNSVSVGICLEGGLDETGRACNNFTYAQFASLRQLLEVMKRAYPQAKVLGHRDLSPDLNNDGVITSNEWMKECPCFDVQEWLKENDG